MKKQLIQAFVICVVIFTGKANATSNVVSTLLDAYKKYDLVAIGEGSHGSIEPIRFMQRVLSDKKMQQTLDVLVVEFATAAHQETLDKFIFGEDVAHDELRLVWRNTTQSPMGPWDRPIYFELLNHIRDVNKNLSQDKKIRVLAGEPSVPWNEIDSWDKYEKYLGQRDLFAADQANSVISQSKKVLVFYGSVHVAKLPDGTSDDIETYPLVYNLISMYKRSVFSIGFMNTESLQFKSNLKQGSVIRTVDKFPNMQASKYFPDIVDPKTNQRKLLYTHVKLSQVYDAFIYLGDSSMWTESIVPLDVYQDDKYWAELNRRSQALVGFPMPPSMRKEN